MTGLIIKQRLDFKIKVNSDLTVYYFFCSNTIGYRWYHNNLDAGRHTLAHTEIHGDILLQDGCDLEIINN